METVIRSPQDGVVKKLTHKEGVRWSFASSTCSECCTDRTIRIFASPELYWYGLRKMPPRKRSHDFLYLTSDKQGRTCHIVCDDKRRVGVVKVMIVFKMLEHRGSLRGPSYRAVCAIQSGVS